MLVEPRDEAKGQEFSTPGVNCSPQLVTAEWHARPQVVFGDTIFQRIAFKLKIDSEKMLE